MKYIELTKKIKEPVFSLQDLKLAGIKLYPYQLSDWVKKGYIIKLKNGLYAIADRRSGLAVEHIAFLLYRPSYISLEWALSVYGLIPEMVYHPTSVTSRTTRIFTNEFGRFSYRHVKPDLFFGYERREAGGRPYLMAEPEKALFDYLYLNASAIKNEGDAEELRLNEVELRKLDRQKLNHYCDAAGNERVRKILNMIGMA